MHAEFSFKDEFPFLCKIFIDKLVHIRILKIKIIVS